MEKAHPKSSAISATLQAVHGPDEVDFRYFLLPEARASENTILRFPESIYTHPLGKNLDEINFNEAIAMSASLLIRCGMESAEMQKILAMLAEKEIHLEDYNSSLLRHSYEVAANSISIIHKLLRKEEDQDDRLEFLYDIARASSQYLILASFLHDFGKTDSKIWEAIAHPGILTREQIILMKEHPEEGLNRLIEVMQRHPNSKIIADIIILHHAITNNPYPQIAVERFAGQQESKVELYNALRSAICALIITYSDFTSAFTRNESKLYREYKAEDLKQLLYSKFTELTVLSSLFAQAFGGSIEEAKFILQKKFIPEFTNLAINATTSRYNIYSNHSSRE